MDDQFVEENFDVNGVQVKSELDADGRFEFPDPVPMAPPVGVNRQYDELADMIKRLVRNEISARAVDEGYETFDEADDLDIPDDPLDPLTPYEKVFEVPPVNGATTRGSPDVAVSTEAPTVSGEGSAGSGGAKAAAPDGAAAQPLSKPAVAPDLEIAGRTGTRTSDNQGRQP